MRRLRRRNPPDGAGGPEHLFLRGVPEAAPDSKAPGSEAREGGAVKKALNHLRGADTVLGAHIEMSTTPGQDYAFGAVKHPNEHPLPQGLDQLLELDRAVTALGTTPELDRHPHFIIYP